ncbi:MAG: VOC family protein [Clostridia bacterium]|nr:VOC family protein [Clostridia bacterium]
MNYKGTLIVVENCDRALKFYKDMFGFSLLKDNGGNMELTGGLYLQEAKYFEKFTNKSTTSKSNSSELYFEETDIESFVGKLQNLYPETEYVNRIMTHDWGQRVVRFYDPDGNLIEVGTPV